MSDRLAPEHGAGVRLFRSGDDIQEGRDGHGVARYHDHPFASADCEVDALKQLLPTRRLRQVLHAQHRLPVDLGRVEYDVRVFSR